MNSIGAALLAAGSSLRMGQPKGLLPWMGRTLLEHQVLTLLGSSVTEIAVVLGAGADDLYALLPSDDRIHVVFNPLYATGRTSSLILGVLALRHLDAIVICNLDQPLTHSLLAELIAGAELEPSYPTAVPRYAGRIGHPTLVRRELYAEVLAVTEGTEGLKAVVRRDPRRVLEVPTSSPNTLMAFNTPAEYRDAVARLSRGELDAG